MKTFLPKWNQGDRLLSASLVGSFLLVANTFSLLSRKLFSILTASSYPGRAHATGPTFLSASLETIASSQSIGCKKIIDFLCLYHDSCANIDKIRIELHKEVACAYNVK